VFRDTASKNFILAHFIIFPMLVSEPNGAIWDGLLGAVIGAFRSGDKKKLAGLRWRSCAPRNLRTAI
jgi:hypothetical protein